jgi:uncharacterized protein (TIGR02270 family)
MATPRARYIAELLPRHAEDLAFLWGQRREALQSRRHTLREFGEIGERIEAHAQGLLVPPAAAVAALLAPQLASEDRDEAFAAGYGLLRRADVAITREVIAAFAQASGATLAGLRDAFSMAPFKLFVGEMQAALDRARPPTAAAAAVVLANHRVLRGQAPRLAELVEHEDPEVCGWAWRAAGLADARGDSPAHTRPYQHALAHPVAWVRSAAWSAAAWTGQAQALPLLRHVSAQGDAVALRWLAVLGGPEDVPTLQRAALAIADPEARCRLLARFGHPSALNALVRWMAEPDVALAAASGEAFARITGIDLRARREQLPVPADADDFEREMAPLVWLPDADKARAAMDERGAEWMQGTRWCQGQRVDTAPAPEQFSAFDLEARWDIGARAALARRAVCVPPPVH